MHICCQDLIGVNDGDDVESLHDRGLHWGACHETVGTPATVMSVAMVWRDA